MVHWDGAEIGGAVIGGSLIAFSAMINLFFLGRVTGMSGIFYSLFKLDKQNGLIWKTAFVAGLFSIPYIASRTDNTGVELGDGYLPFYDSREMFAEDLEYPGYAIAGLLVGLGTKMGNGCTSGHGVCGLARFSKRSFVAVGTFMATAFIMANFRYYVPFLTDAKVASNDFQDGYEIFGDVMFGLVQLAGAVAVVYSAVNAEIGRGKIEALVSYFIGSIFGAGLLTSGMLRRSKIAGFLTFNDDWDPTLAFVLGAAVTWNSAATHFILQADKNAFGEPLMIPKKKEIDPYLVAGSAIFGLGWGLGALCPGPAFIDFLTYYQLLIWGPCCVMGMMLAEPIKSVCNRLCVKVGNDVKA